jgi:hypothetical protein
MTAEICILNREAVAMASDSAATVELTTPSGQLYKYFPTVDKIFEVGSDVHTIGVMIYQSPTIMEVPWETLIKLWGDSLEDRPLPRVSDYANSLLAFVQSHEVIRAADQQEHHFRQTTELFTAGLLRALDARVRTELEQFGEVSEARRGEITRQVIVAERNRWLGLDALTPNPNRRAAAVIEQYGSILNQTVRRYFVNNPLTDDDRAAITETAGNLFFRNDRAVVAYTGLVIAGYGEDDIFPAVQHFEVEGLIDNFLKHRLIEEFKAGIEPKQHARIIPFAQQEMVRAFIVGAEEVSVAELKSFAQQSFEELVVSARMSKERREAAVEAALAGWDDAVKGYADDRGSAVQLVVGMLPKRELAAMADTLVSLTSFKRRVSPEVESVGGPTDVAIISKSEGFRWFRRKDWDPLYPWESHENGLTARQ